MTFWLIKNPVYIVHKLYVVWRKGIHCVCLLIVFRNEVYVIVELFAFFYQILKYWVWWVYSFFWLNLLLLSTLKQVVYVLIQCVVILGLTSILMLPIWSFVDIVRCFISILHNLFPGEYCSVLSLLRLSLLSLILMQVAFVFVLPRHDWIIDELTISKIDSLLVIKGLLGNNLFIRYFIWMALFICNNGLIFLKLKIVLIYVSNNHTIWFVLGTSRLPQLFVLCHDLIIIFIIRSLLLRHFW